MLDIKQVCEKVRHNSESEGRKARSAKADESEEGPKSDNVLTLSNTVEKKIQYQQTSLTSR